MRKLIISIVLFLFLLGCKQAQVSPAYLTQQECEQKEGCRCGFVICDYIPEGKTYEEVCGKNFREGWQCVA